MSRLIFVAAFINACAVAVLGASRIERFREYWNPHPKITLAALFVTALVPIAQAFLSERGEKARRKSVERERKVETFLTTALVNAVENAGANLTNTGVQAFMVGGWWSKAHIRLAKVRLGGSPSSGITWSKGKGVIGRCWDTQSVQCVDLTAAFAPYRSYSKERWEALGAEVRYGLSFEDFQRIGHKYGVVAAVPIIDSKDKYVGCVTLDTPAPNPDEAGHVNQQEVLKSLTLIAHLVKEVL